MTFPLLFLDELKGFYKSKVMIFLWIGMPLMTVLFHLWAPDTGPGLPFTMVSSLLVSSIGGTLAAVMLSVSIINEKTNHMYDLFLIRPIKRWQLLVSKFLAVYTCIVVASSLAVLLGMGIDYGSGKILAETVLTSAIQSFVINLSMLAVASTAGVLTGVIAPSILVGVILVIYGANQISVIPLIPNIINTTNPVFFTIVLGTALSCALLLISLYLFNKKQF